jgi:tetratricopeptide (TPR) repeat protein
MVPDPNSLEERLMLPMDQEEKPSFGCLLRGHMRGARISQSGLAKRLHCDRSTVAKWLSGDIHKPDRDMVLALKGIFKLGIGQLNELLIAAHWNPEPTPEDEVFRYLSRIAADLGLVKGIADTVSETRNLVQMLSNSISRQTPDFLTGAAENFVDGGAYKNAIVCYETAKRIHAQLGNVAEQSYIEEQLSRLYRIDNSPWRGTQRNHEALITELERQLQEHSSVGRRELAFSIAQETQRMGFQAARAGDWDLALAKDSEALMMLRVLGGTPRAISDCLYDIASVYRDQGAYEKAFPLYRACLHLRNHIDPKEYNPALPWNVVAELARLYVYMNRPRRAMFFGQLTLKAFRRLPEPGGTAYTLRALGEIYRVNGDMESSVAYLNEAYAIDIRERLASKGVAGDLHQLALTYTAWGKTEEAQPKAQEAIRLYRYLEIQHHDERLQQIAAGLSAK